MKKRTTKLLPLFLSIATVFSLSTPVLADEATPTETGKIVILHTNDVHCEINQAVEDGTVTNMGYASVAAYKQEMETTYGAANVTLVDAGDAIQGGPIGTLTKGTALVDIMNAVGYDIAIPGNHEFDYGMDNFLALAKDKAEYTYICSNFTDLRSDSKSSVFKPYEIITYGDVQVAYVGIDTPETLTKSTPTHFQDAEGNYIYTFWEDETGAALYTNVQKSVDDARAEGADYVVALGHLGTSGSTEKWNSETVIKNTTGINIMIDGHSHESYEKIATNQSGENVVLAQTGTKLSAIGKLTIDTKTGAITNELVTGYTKQDPATTTLIETISKDFEAILAEVVAKTTVPLTTNDPATGDRAVRNAETNLGDLVADAYRSAMGADVALINGGGVRASIASGDITNGDLLKVQPYSNELCLIEVTGQQIKDALEMGARNFPDENGGFQQVSGLTCTIDASIPTHVVLNDKNEFVKVDGAYRVTDITIGGQPIDLTKTYTMASHNFMIKSGGDGFVMFKNCKLLQDCTKADNQAFIDYITVKLNGVVGTEYSNPYGQGRIKMINNTAEAPNWYYNAARYAIEFGMVNGTDRLGSFTPDGIVTRGTICQILYNLTGRPTANLDKAAFTDTTGKWYADAAAWAKANSITAGKADSTFSGDDAITRAEVAQILSNYCKIVGATADTSGTAMKQAPDYASIPAEYLDGMTFCYYAKIMVGDQNGNLNPNATLTRAELAQLLLNLSQVPVPAADKAA